MLVWQWWCTGSSSYSLSKLFKKHRFISIVDAEMVPGCKFSDLPM
jgi:hypothetical protein